MNTVPKESNVLAKRIETTAPIPSTATAKFAPLVPGLALTVGIAIYAFVLRSVPVLGSFSPLILAIVLGMAFHNLVGTPEHAKAGVSFGTRRILRAGIVLLGLQLTISQVLAVGGAGLLVIVLTLVCTFVATVFLGRALGVDRKLTELIAAGTSICGASAVIATNTVTQGKDEDVAYAVACVTIFGSISMVLYPFLLGALQLAPGDYGLWVGASIHEVAQVVAAAYQGGTEAGDAGMVAKLTRVLMLAPLVLCLASLARRRVTRETGDRASPTVPMPWFVFGFLAMMLVASTGVLPTGVTVGISQVTQFLLVIALAAMGLQTDFRKLLAKGLRPILLGAGSWIFVTTFSLLLVVMT